MSEASPLHRPAQHPLRGIALALVAITGIALSDALVKRLGADMHVVQVAWGRYAFYVIFMVVVLQRGRVLRYVRTASPRLQLLRGVIFLAATFLFFVAIQHLPLADAVAIEFVMPLLVVALASPLLAERVGARRWAAVMVGFAATLVIIRPGLAVFHWASAAGPGERTAVRAQPDPDALAPGPRAGHDHPVLFRRRGGGRREPCRALLLDGSGPRGLGADGARGLPPVAWATTP